MDKEDQLVGHEFHRWELEINTINSHNINIPFKNNLNVVRPIWNVKGWGYKKIEEGWGSDMFHASWIHLHWPSSSKIMGKWREAIERENI